MSRGPRRVRSPDDVGTPSASETSVPAGNAGAGNRKERATMYIGGGVLLLILIVILLVWVF